MRLIDCLRKTGVFQSQNIFIKTNYSDFIVSSENFLDSLYLALSFGRVDSIASIKFLRYALGVGINMFRLEISLECPQSEKVLEDDELVSKRLQ